MKLNPINYVRYLLEFVIIITGVVLSFYLDDSFDEAEKIENLLLNKNVLRDIK